MHDILEELRTAIYDGDAQKAKELTEQALQQGYSTDTIIEKSVFPTMQATGEQLRDGSIFITEVLMSSRAIHGVMYAVKPITSRTNSLYKGTVVIGTVAGDLHDIGKNLVAMALESKGFLVMDLGVDVTKEEFAAAVKRHHPDILALSALLTTTMPELKMVIDHIIEEGLRPQTSIMVGGAPVTAGYAKEIKADVYGKDMFEAAEAAEDLMKKHISKHAV